METKIMYSSLSGNTKKIAEAFATVLPNAQLLETKDVTGAQLQEENLFCIGYWVDKGDCDTLSKQLLSNLQQGNIILFGTLGAAENTQYYHMIKEHVEKNINGPSILGHFLCQGKVGDALIERYKKMLLEHPEDEHMKQQVENYEAGKSHPDDQDIEHAKKFIRDIIKDAR